MWGTFKAPQRRNAIRAREEKNKTFRCHAALLRATGVPRAARAPLAAGKTPINKPRAAMIALALQVPAMTTAPHGRSLSYAQILKYSPGSQVTDHSSKCNATQAAARAMRQFGLNSPGYSLPTLCPTSHVLEATILSPVQMAYQASCFDVRGSLSHSHLLLCSLSLARSVSFLLCMMCPTSNRH